MSSVIAGETHGYAVSDDGVGKITVTGCELSDLFPPQPAAEPEPTPAAEFSAASYAKAHGLNGRELRQKLRAAGLKAPYTLADVEKVVGS